LPFKFFISDSSFGTHVSALRNSFFVLADIGFCLLRPDNFLYFSILTISTNLCCIMITLPRSMTCSKLQLYRAPTDLQISKGSTLRRTLCYISFDKLSTFLSRRHSLSDILIPTTSHEHPPSHACSFPNRCPALLPSQKYFFAWFTTPHRPCIFALNPPSGASAHKHNAPPLFHCTPLQTCTSVTFRLLAPTACAVPRLRRLPLLEPPPFL
jgi:hypothetical protein